VAAQDGPLLVSDDHKRDFPAFQVLLVTHIFVRGQQKLEAGSLGSRYQFAIGEPIPSAFKAFNNDVTCERIPQRGGCAVIEEYEHRPLDRVATGAERRQDYAPRTRSQQPPVHAINGTNP
jgi:hypothetical protein